MSVLGYDVATALWQGARPYQEDTLLVDFHGGMDRGFAILADGMGGHAAGDLASRLVVIDAASHLKFLMHDGEALEKTLHTELTSAIETANDVLKDRAADDRRLHGMGSTFLATVIFEDRLYWASVGDSPLFLWREGALRQLNDDHSMAPVIDQMAKTGEITADEAANHPDRNALTSVLMGQPLKAMDVPKTATVLDPGDVLIQASDGLQFLDNDQISQVVSRGGSSRDIADALMEALRDLDDPSQDNTSVLVLQLTQTRGAKSAAVTGLTSSASERSVGSSRAAVEVGTPRAATPTTLVRTAEARRWLAPVGALGAAAIAAAVLFFPASAPEVELAASAPVIETAELAADAPPAFEVEPPAAAPPTRSLALPTVTFAAPNAAPATPDVASLVPASPVTVPPISAEVNAADVHEIVGETAAIASADVAPVDAAPTAIVGDKFSQPTPQAASSGTIQFDVGQSREGLSAPDAGQAPAVTPLLPPISQRTRLPDASFNILNKNNLYSDETARGGKPHE